jgi:uncharacterized protein
MNKALRLSGIRAKANVRFINRETDPFLAAMRTKSILCILCLTLLSGLVAAQDSGARSTDPAKAALIEEMMTLTRPDRMLAQFLQQYKAAFSRGLEESFRHELSKYNEDAAKYQPELHRFEDQMFGFIAKRMSWEEMKPKFIAIYDETFSQQELADIVAFYKTRSGQSLLQKTPGLVAKGSQVGQAQMSDSMAEIQRLTAAFIEDLRKAHTRVANPEKKS